MEPRGCIRWEIDENPAVEWTTAQMRCGNRPQGGRQVPTGRSYWSRNPRLSRRWLRFPPENRADLGVLECYVKLLTRSDTVGVGLRDKRLAEGLRYGSFVVWLFHSLAEC